jgi:hypothetical protein
MVPEAYKIGSNFNLKRVAEWTPDWDEPPMGFFVMWEPPRPGTDYTIGVDPSWGIGQDNAAIHVLRNGTVKEKDTQVGEFCANTVNVHDLTPICYMLGELYKNTVEDRLALMSVECNISDDVVHRLRNDYNYNNLFIWKSYDKIKHVESNKFGWWTTSRTRPKIISKAIHYVNQGWWDIKSPWLLTELQTLEKLDDKQRVEAAKGHHDDLAMAGFIALWSAHDMEFNDYGQTEELAKRRDRSITGILDAYTPSLKPITERRDFINTPCSVAEMMDYEFPERSN